MTPLQDAIVDIYTQVAAPDWAAPNLDGLTDVLRDLSWLPDGEVLIGVPMLAGDDGERLVRVITRVAQESRHGPHPIDLQ